MHCLDDLLAHGQCRHFALALLALLVWLELFKVPVCPEWTEVLPLLVVEKTVYLAVESCFQSVLYYGIHVLD